MKKKFNPKEYRKMKRIEVAVNSNPGISRIFVWDEQRQEYQPPPRGKLYMAEKKIKINLESKYVRKSFNSLEEARDWRFSRESDAPHSSQSNDGPTFSKVVDTYRRDKMPHLRQSTQISYNRMIDKYLKPLMCIHMRDFSPQIIDEWISYMKSLEGKEIRISFKHEFSLLSGILKFYALHDDNFESPLRERHKIAIKVRHNTGVKSKDLSEQEFYRFRSALGLGKNGFLMQSLATIQFYQALRISEVAALRWEDVRGDFANPTSMRITISQSVLYPRTGSEKPSIQPSFKNGKQNGGVKELPLMPQAVSVLLDLYNKSETKKGLIFLDSEGLLTYRQIQHSYDTAFRRANLLYSGTHLLRHGGARWIYNKSEGDLSKVQQLLGNSDYKTTLVYAKRSSNALNEFVEQEWKSLQTSEPTNAHKLEK